MERAVPPLCEVCGLAAPARGVGFPAWPGALPGLPEYLRGACLWVCHARACDLTAQRRAATAARSAGLTLTKIWRTTRFDLPGAPLSKRTGP